MVEILENDPDVLCLQEVHARHFDSHFLPNLRAHGYEGVYKKRTGDKEDGCATFYKTEKVWFKVISFETRETLFCFASLTSSTRPRLSTSSPEFPSWTGTTSG